MVGRHVLRTSSRSRSPRPRRRVSEEGRDGIRSTTLTAPLPQPPRCWYGRGAAQLCSRADCESPPNQMEVLRYIVQQAQGLGQANDGSAVAPPSEWTGLAGLVRMERMGKAGGWACRHGSIGAWLELNFLLVRSSSHRLLSAPPRRPLRRRATWRL